MKKCIWFALFFLTGCSGPRPLIEAQPLITAMIGIHAPLVNAPPSWTAAQGEWVPYEPGVSESGYWSSFDTIHGIAPSRYMAISRNYFFGGRVESYPLPAPQAEP